MKKPKRKEYKSMFGEKNLWLDGYNQACNEWEVWLKSQKKTKEV